MAELKYLVIQKLRTKWKYLGDTCISSNAQIYYIDGITAYINRHGDIIVNGTSHNIELHKTMAILKRS